MNISLHSITKHLLRAFSRPDTILGSGDGAVKEIKSLHSRDPTFQRERQGLNKYQMYVCMHTQSKLIKGQKGVLLINWP